MQIGHVEIPDKVRAQSSTWIAGSPGYGKSMLMLYAIMDDLSRRQPFCLLDMHGKLFRMVKSWCAYNEYTDRQVIIVDPAEGKYVKPYNPFKRRDSIDRSVQIGGMVKAVLSVWGESDIGTFSNIFKLLTVLFTLITENELSLLQGFSLLPNRERMKKAVAGLKDPVLDTLWGDLMKLAPSEWSRHIAPTLTRLFRVICSESMKRFLCSVDGNLELTFEDTILVNLGKGGRIDSDAANVFAALLLNDLYLSSFRRKGEWGKDPDPYYVYVDEWWLVNSPDYRRILFETRKAGLLLILANQDLSQIRETFGSNFAESIHTLTQIKIIFGGIGDEDAGRLARELKLDRSVLTSLGKRECIIKLSEERARVVTVPTVQEPYVSEERLEEYERSIAEQTGAYAIQEFDSRPRIDNIEGDTLDGYPIQ